MNQSIPNRIRSNYNEDSNNRIFDCFVCSTYVSVAKNGGCILITCIEEHDCTDQKPKLRKKFDQIDNILQKGISTHNSGLKCSSDISFCFNFFSGFIISAEDCSSLFSISDKLNIFSSLFFSRLSVSSGEIFWDNMEVIGSCKND